MTNDASAVAACRVRRRATRELRRCPDGVRAVFVDRIARSVSALSMALTGRRAGGVLIQASYPERRSVIPAGNQLEVMDQRDWSGSKVTRGCWEARAVWRRDRAHACSERAPRGCHLTMGATRSGRRPVTELRTDGIRHLPPR